MEIYHPRDDELIREMKRVRRSDRRRRLIWGISVLLILSIAAGWFVFSTYYQLAVIHGPAMGDTLPDGTLVLVRKPEAGKSYSAGDIILYEKRLAAPVELTILSEKGKTRDYCQYILYRDVGTTRQYYAVVDEAVTWIAAQGAAQTFESSEEGVVRIETDNLKNGDYWLKEVKASYGQDVLKDPIPFTVNNPVRTQIKRILAAPGDRVVSSPSDIRVNSQPIDTSFTSGRTIDALPDARRVIMGKNKYYVQGDQLSLSIDSRKEDYSSVSDDEILGQVEFAIWPLRSFGKLTGQTAASTTDESGQEAAE